MRTDSSHNKTAPPILNADFDVEEVLQSLSFAEKCTLIAGKDLFTTNSIPAKGIPSLKFGDGPAGCRGAVVFNGQSSNCFPCGVALGSTFDSELVHEIGQHLADEARAKNVHVLLGPTVNIHRSPLGGRVFEFLSEDPYLSGKLAAEYVKGVQSKKIATSMKHFLGNEQEWEKHRTTSHMTPRAMREIYLEPFRMAVKFANPWTFMTSYNKIKGVHTAESEFLIKETLRGEWGWEGLTMCDWGGLHSTEKGIKAGLDLEMPGPSLWRTMMHVHKQVEGGYIDMEDVDACVRNCLGLVKRAIASGVPFDPTENSIDSTYSRELLRRSAAASTILLKNDAQLLPLRKDKGIDSITVIGGSALQSYTSGGGSASILKQPFRSSPLDGVTTLASEEGIRVDYAFGHEAYKCVPSLEPYMVHPDGRPAEQGLARLELWRNSPHDAWKTAEAGIRPTTRPDHALDAHNAKCYILDGMPDDILKESNFVRYTTDFVPAFSGDWVIGYAGFDCAYVFIDDELQIEYVTDLNGSSNFFYGMPYAERRKVMKGLVAGRKYRVDIRAWRGGRREQIPDFMPACFRIGATIAGEEDELIKQAAVKAKEADVAIVVVGLHEDYEQEGLDRDDWELPGAYDKLIEAVIEANPKTIVVNQSGSPVYMPWAKRAAGVVQAFYGGTALGEGLADVLFGRVNPSAKLAVSFPEHFEDLPSFNDSAMIHPATDHVFYHEDIFVGYRGFDRRQRKALFPFGHGLSYTTFEFSDLVVPPRIDLSEADKDWSLDISVTITNTGKVAGRGVAQLYVRDLVSSLTRPIKELKGFAGAFLQPGKSETVVITLERNAFSFWKDGDKEGWLAEAGDFEIIVGESSVDVRLTASTKLERTVKWKGL